MLNIHEIRKNPDGLDFEVNFDLVADLKGRNPEILGIRDVLARGKAQYEDGLYFLDYDLSYTITLASSRSMEPVERKETYLVNEIFMENHGEKISQDLIDDDLIEYCAQSRAFMPHFHIPLQSGSDEVLKLMHRRYDTKLFAHKINLIKEKMPDAFIGVDVMVGSRGERPQYFEDCYNFLASLPVTQLHVFPYSERPGTSALSIPYVVDNREKKHRAHKLLKLSDEKTHAFYAAHIGQEADVLFEKAARGKAMHGFTDNYIRVELSPSQAKEEYDNQIIRVRLGGFNYDQSSLKAELL